jgi:hypothetical protein
VFDWVNGYDDDGDGLIDEDYFFEDGIDNDGDGDIDENIDGFVDKYIDGYDNDGNGIIDDSNELASTNTGYDDAPAWGYNIDQLDVLVGFGRKYEYTNYYDSTKNIWFTPDIVNMNDLCQKGQILINGDICADPHLKGNSRYNEDRQLYEFDVFLFDFGEDQRAGDGFWDDLQGDGEFQTGEPLSSLGFFGTTEDVGLDGIPGTNDFGEGDDIWQPGDGWVDFNGNGIVDLGTFGESGYDYYELPNQNDYDDVWPPKNGLWDEGETIYDYGQDGIPGTGDFGENDGILLAIDQYERDGLRDTGDNLYNYSGDPSPLVSVNGSPL